MCRIQPQGPYDLVGYSFGGVVAFEIAQQLVARGDQVGFLALIDSAYPGQLVTPSSMPGRLLRLVLKRIRTIRRLGLRAFAPSVLLFLRTARLGSVTAAHAAAVSNLRARSRGISEDELAWIDADARAFADYHPTAYPGHVTFLWAVGALVASPIRGAAGGRSLPGASTFAPSTGPTGAPSRSRSSSSQPAS